MSSANRFLRAVRRPLSTRFALLLVLAAALIPLRAVAVTTTQTLTLKPGWNSIFLEVAPTNPDPAAVFAGLPVDQVWAFFPTKSPVQYLSDPGAGLFNVPGWNVYLPAGSRPDAAYLTDLKGIIGHQAYLVKNTSTAAATLTVTGTAGLQGVKWNPDSYTLTGLAVDPTTTVRSGDFFANSPAHTAQPRYRLDPNGTWVALTDAAALAAGQAYWVFTKGGSDFSAPLEVSFGGGRTLDFGPNGESAQLTVRNRSAYAATVTLANPGALPLSYQLLDAAATVPGNVWKTLPAELSLPLPLPALNGTTPATTIAPGQSTTVTVGVRRAGLAADLAGFIRVASSGVALNVPVAAQLATSTAVAGRSAAPNAAPPPNANAGLWVGAATLNAVSEANTTSATPTPTSATFALRLLIHVDANGAARLLKEITLMKGRVAAGQTPPLVLVSDPALLSGFDAPTIRDGSPFANRISAIGFDFASSSISLGSGFGTQLSGVVTIGRELPTNPFKHKYHPDHDDLNAQFQTPAANLPPDQQEVWGVTRTLQLTFDPPPTNNSSPSSGYSERTGTYLETLSGVGTTRLPTNPNTDVANPGLHKRNIVVSGPFTLRRLNSIATLNAAP